VFTTGKERNELLKELFEDFESDTNSEAAPPEGDTNSQDAVTDERGNFPESSAPNDDMKIETETAPSTKHGGTAEGDVDDVDALDVQGSSSCTSSCLNAVTSTMNEDRSTFQYPGYTPPI